MEKKPPNEPTSFQYWNEYMTSYSPSILEHFKVKSYLSTSIYSMRRVESGWTDRLYRLYPRWKEVFHWWGGEVRNILKYIIDFSNQNTWHWKRDGLLRVASQWRGKFIRIFPVSFEGLTAVTMKNAVVWDIRTQIVPHRRHITSPLQSPAG
jgi:hypothetical protein